MRIVLIGGVNSSLRTLNKLINHDMAPVTVFGFEPASTELVSGHASLGPLCEAQNIPFVPFTKINQHAEQIAELNPDVIFVVGISQLVSQAILDSAKLGCIGFHPTALPRGRGRAPIAWLALAESEGAANLFLMGEGADDGPIFSSVKFKVEDDDAESVEVKILDSLDKALDNWLPDLKQGRWDPVPQDEALATYFGVRKPEDGNINWHDSAQYIDKLIKASSRPHPGAFSFVGMKKVLVWRSRIESDMPIRGVVGRILLIDSQGSVLVQTGDGLIWLDEFEVENQGKLRIGSKLGLYPELEIVKLHQQIEQLKEMMNS